MFFFHFQRLQRIEAEYPAATKLIDKNVIALGIAVMGFLINSFTNIVLTHILSKTTYGDFSLCASVIGFLGSIVLLGNDQSSIKFIPNYFKSQEYGLLHGILLYYGRSLLIMTSLVLLINFGMYKLMHSSFALDSTRHLVWKYLWIIPFAGVTSIFAMCLRSFKRGFYALITQNVLPGLLMMFVIMIIYYFNRQLFTLNKIMWIYFLTVYLATGLVQILGLFHIVPWQTFQHPSEYNRKMWFTTGVQLLLSALIYDGESSIVNLTLKFTGHSSSEIGSLSVAMTLYVATWLGCSACNAILSPLISPAAANKDIPTLQRLTNIGNTIVFVSGFLLCICFALFGKHYLAWFGKEYVDAYSTLLILSFGSLIAFAGSMSLPLLEYAVPPRILMNLTMIGTGVIVLAGIPLCHYFGIEGAAMEVVLIESGLTLIYAHRLKKDLKIKPFGII